MIFIKNCGQFNARYSDCHGFEKCAFVNVVVLRRLNVMLHYSNSDFQVINRLIKQPSQQPLNHSENIILVDSLHYALPSLT
jgi:hypothetical protein